MEKKTLQLLHGPKISFDTGSSLLSVFFGLAPLIWISRTLLGMQLCVQGSVRNPHDSVASLRMSLSLVNLTCLFVSVIH